MSVAEARARFPDDIRTVYVQLDALACLLRLAGYEDGLTPDELRGVYEMLENVTRQARQLEETYETLAKAKAA